MTGPLYERALEGWERVLGPDHPDTLTSVNNLAGLYRATGRSAEAEPLYERALEGSERVLGPDHPDTLNSLWAYFEHRAEWVQRQGEPAALRPEADALLRTLLTQAARTFADRTVTDADQIDPTSPAARARTVLAAYRAALRAGDIGAADPLADAAFTLSQSFAGSETAAALAVSSLLATPDNPAVQKLDAELRSAEADYATAISTLAVLRENDAPIATIRAQEAARDTANAARQRLRAELERSEDGRLLLDLQGSETVDAARVQAALKPAEALIAYSFAPRNDDLLAFVVTPKSLRAVPLEVNKANVARQVDTLRAALTASDDTSPRELLLNQVYSLTTAHDLHQAIFTPLEPYLSNTSDVFVVPDGALQSLPLQVLVRELPEAGLNIIEQYRSADWLGDGFAMTTLPAVNNLTALRRNGISRADGDFPLLAFADPLLGDDDGRDRRVTYASLDPARLLYLSGTADRLDDLPPVPQTGMLALNVARDVEAETFDIYYARAMREVRLHDLQRDGELGKYRTILFATHALTGTEGLYDAQVEPALVFSRPDPTRLPGNDNGLLHASEIIRLDGFNADLVILAGCNTAASQGTQGAAALSGLAKSFLLSGTRSVLVSHWPAEANATAQLVPTLISEMERSEPNEPSVSRARALQRAMQAVRNKEGSAYGHWSHPAMWAPFMLVGESQQD